MPKWGKIAKSGHTVSNITDFLFQVGHTNPRVELWLADLSGGSIEKKQILAPFSLSNEEAHFSWVVWPNQDQFENNYEVQATHPTTSRNSVNVMRSYFLRKNFSSKLKRMQIVKLKIFENANNRHENTLATIFFATGT